MNFQDNTVAGKSDTEGGMGGAGSVLAVKEGKKSGDGLRRPWWPVAAFYVFTAGTHSRVQAA